MSTNVAQDLQTQIAQHLEQDITEYDYAELARLTRRYRAQVVGENARTFWQDCGSFLRRIGAVLASWSPKRLRLG